jgi:ankyrin repeat protein
MLDQGVDPNVPCQPEGGPLHITILKGHEYIFYYLLERHVKLNVPSPEGGFTPLHLAVRHGRTNMIKYLLAAGASQDVPDQQGFYPIHTAAMHGHSNALKLLLQYGGNPLLLTPLGENVLHLAVRTHALTCCQCLFASLNPSQLMALHHGTNQEQEGGMTPLHIACAEDGLALVAQLLLEQDAWRVSPNASELGSYPALKGARGSGQNITTTTTATNNNCFELVMQKDNAVVLAALLETCRQSGIHSTQLLPHLSLHPLQYCLKHDSFGCASVWVQYGLLTAPMEGEPWKDGLSVGLSLEWMVVLGQTLRMRGAEKALDYWESILEESLQQPTPAEEGRTDLNLCYQNYTVSERQALLKALRDEEPLAIPQMDAPSLREEPVERVKEAEQGPASMSVEVEVEKDVEKDVEMRKAGRVVPLMQKDPSMSESTVARDKSAEGVDVQQPLGNGRDGSAMEVVKVEKEVKEVKEVKKEKGEASSIPVESESETVRVMATNEKMPQASDNDAEKEAKAMEVTETMEEPVSEACVMAEPPAVSNPTHCIAQIRVEMSCEDTTLLPFPHPLPKLGAPAVRVPWKAVQQAESPRSKPLAATLPDRLSRETPPIAIQDPASSLLSSPLEDIASLPPKRELVPTEEVSCPSSPAVEEEEKEIETVVEQGQDSAPAPVQEAEHDRRANDKENENEREKEKENKAEMEEVQPQPPLEVTHVKVRETEPELLPTRHPLPTPALNHSRERQPLLETMPPSPAVKEEETETPTEKERQEHKDKVREKEREREEIPLQPAVMATPLVPLIPTSIVPPAPETHEIGIDANMTPSWFSKLSSASQEENEEENFDGAPSRTSQWRWFDEEEICGDQSLAAWSDMHEAMEEEEEEKEKEEEEEQNVQNMHSDNAIRPPSPLRLNRLQVASLTQRQQT